ncbi:TetR/AcrR family transcriptional regulator [Curvivirga sp.]|uniref:TetR/AcrR family transcriptional regulator n=1 Tax=Curvivirga sp. TaxID=2856848 RepID=UPI003B59C161
MAENLSKKEQTRLKMLDAASRSFRKNGYAGIGVDGIAKAAGVTSGAFYAHLGSKNAAFEEILMMGLNEVVSGIQQFQKESGDCWIEAFCDYYLGLAHRSNLECGCAMASLTPEVIKSSSTLHELYAAKMIKIVSIFTQGLAGVKKEERAWATLSTLIGGLNVLRAMGNPEGIEKIAQSIKDAAQSIAGETIDINAK